MLKKHILCLNCYYIIISIPLHQIFGESLKITKKFELTQNITTQKSPWIEGKYMVTTQ